MQAITPLSFQFWKLYDGFSASGQIADMAQEVFDLLGWQRRAFGEMALYPLGLALKREGAGQRVKRVLAHPVDQVSGRVERGRVGL